MNKIFYFCDRKKCERCGRLCLHTSDPEHALDKKEWGYVRDAWGNYVQATDETYEYEVVEALNAATDNRPCENV